MSEGEVKGIHAERVSAWFEANVAGVKPPFSFSPIKGGHSNLTYKVVDAEGGRYVLRRPPLGAILATAHDMGREHKIITAVANPRPRARAPHRARPAGTSRKDSRPGLPPSPR